MDNLESKLNKPFADTMTLLEQNDKSRFPSVKSFAKKAVSAGLMLTMLYSGAAQLNASAANETSLESSTGSYEKADPNNGVKKKHKSALPWILAGAVVTGAIVYFLTQKKSPTPDPNPVPKTYTVKVYNIMKSDVQRTITFDSLSDVTKTLNSTDVAIAGVYNKYIVIREEGNANELGQWLAFGKNSSASFKTPANTALCAYFFENMDNDRNDLYDKMIENGIQNAEIPPGRNSSWYRFDADGQGGPQSAWDHAAAQLNNALSYAFKVGSISATGGTKHKYGYRFCGGSDGSKSFSEFWIGVNSDKIGVDWIIPLERTALEEWFEYVTYSNNIDDKPSQMTICDSQKSDMNMTGVRLIRAVYTAHNKNIRFE